MFFKPKRLQLLIAIMATVALLIPSLSLARQTAPQAGATIATASIGGLDMPHRSDSLLVTLKPSAIPSVAFASDKLALQSQATEFAIGLHPDTTTGLHSLTANSISLQDLFARVGAQSGYELWPGTAVYQLNLGSNADLAAAMTTLAADPHVAAVQPNYIYTVDSVAGLPTSAPVAGPQYMPLATGAPNDPIYPQQWAIPQIQLDQAWNISTGKDLTIAFLDTGVSKGHPDIGNKVVDGYNFVKDNADYQDDFGHGTFTAGIAAADTNNGIGIAGVCWACKVMSLKVLGSDGSGDSSGFVRALHYAADKGVRVISISAGDEQRDTDMGDAVNYAWSKGAFIAASSGNKPDGKPNYPAGYDNSMAVGATARLDAFTGFSSFGPYVDITAPGVGIWSSIWESGNDTYNAENGTSASCPFVAGVAALMFSVNPNLSNQQIRDILENSADDIGTPGWDEHYGNGRVNALRALQYAQDAGNHSGHANLRLSANALPAGSAITVHGDGFNGGEKVEVFFVYADGHRKDLSYLNADGNGNISLNTFLPADVTPNNEPEDYAVRAYGQGSHRNAAASIVIQSGSPIGVPPQPTQPVSSASPTPGPSQPTLPTAPGPRPAAFDKVADPHQQEVSFFAATGHTLRDPFLTYWKQHGGLAQFGYPLSEPYSEVSSTNGNTYTVQYFERNRFEYHPENPASQQVLLGLLGVQLTSGQSFPISQPFANTPGYAYFSPTRHSLGNDHGFLDYWQQHGGLALYGYPISEEIVENGLIVQYFERNRFEYHPELPDPYKVSLGLLGSQLLRDFGWVQ